MSPQRRFIQSPKIFWKNFIVTHFHFILNSKKTTRGIRLHFEASNRELKYTDLKLAGIKTFHSLALKDLTADGYFSVSADTLHVSYTKGSTIVTDFCLLH